MTICSCLDAIPNFHIGQVVHYRDNQGRAQVGKITYIEAKWTDYSRGQKTEAEPLMSFTVEQPTYHRRRTYVCADRIEGEAP